LNSENEVGWYRLSQVQGMLGNVTERQKAFAEFQRLRQAKASRQQASKEPGTSGEVTPQRLDSDTTQ